jgi:hypothetical protein
MRLFDYFEIGAGVPGTISTGEGGTGETHVKVSMSQVEVTIHPVIKEQLVRFMELTRDPWRERFWALVGAVIAAAPAAGESLYSAYFVEPAIALSAWHLIEIIIFVTAGFGALLIKLFTKPREMEAQTLYNQIMNRSTEKISVSK